MRPGRLLLEGRSSRPTADRFRSSSGGGVPEHLARPAPVLRQHRRHNRRSAAHDALAVLAQRYILSGALEDAAFTIFLHGRMFACVAEVGEQKPDRNMDTRKPASQGSFVS